MKDLRSLRILLVDDFAIVRHGLIQALGERSPRAKFGESETGAAAVELVRRQQWDVVVLDITLPDRSGIEVLKEIRGIAPKLPVLILTMHEEEQFALRALGAGASGYVTKKASLAEIVQAVFRVIRGERYITESLAEKLAVEFGRDTQRMPHETLTNRESEVFALLTRGYTVKEIARRLSVSVQTVSTHRARLLEKMGMSTHAELVEYAILNRLF